MIGKIRQIERWKNLKQPTILNLNCYICGKNINLETCKKYIANDIFNAGKLIRYQCPNCDVIFGDLRFLNLTEKDIANDYDDLYSYYGEGENTDFIVECIEVLRVKNIIQKTSSMIDYGCGKWNKIIEKLTKKGYSKCYGYDKYVENKQKNILTDIQNKRFDVIYSNNLIEHFIQPIQQIKELLSHLENNGKLIFFSGCFDTYRFEYTHYHVFFYVGKSIEELCKQVGMYEYYGTSINDHCIKVFSKQNILYNNKICIFYGTHQIETIYKILKSIPEFMNRYDIIKLYKNDEFKNGDISQHIYDEISDCDLFVYQQFEEICEKKSMFYLKKLLKKECIKIGFPYIYNIGLDDIYTEEILNYFNNGFTLTQVLSMLKFGGINFNIGKKVKENFDRMKKNEIDIEFPLSNYISKKIKYIVNFTRDIFYDVLILTMNKLDIQFDVSMINKDLIDEKYIKNIISSYEKNTLGLVYAETDNWLSVYEQFIDLIYKRWSEKK